MNELTIPMMRWAYRALADATGSADKGYWRGMIERIRRHEAREVAAGKAAMEAGLRAKPPADEKEGCPKW
jgi:hypothetical protein